jgi:hypothetical protein
MKFKRLLRTLFRRDRLSQRVDGAEATVHIDGAPHLVVDWSEGGMRIANYDGAPPVGERFAFRFVLPLTSEDVFEFEAWAEVLDNSPRGVAARFLFIEDDLAARLRAVIRVLGTTEIAVPAGAVDYS